MSITQSMEMTEKPRASIHKRTMSLDPAAGDHTMEKPYLDTSRSSIDSAHEEDDLLESQPVVPEQSAAPPEYAVPYRKKLLYLALYFLLNLSLTLSNKGILQQVKTPWLLTAMHATATSIGCSILLLTGNLKLSKLAVRETLILFAFSMLFTLNIAVSNVSLAMVSVPFHQIARSTCPAVTVIIYRVVFQRTYSQQTYLSIVPLIIGVVIATIGDLLVTPVGFAMTALGVFLASAKTVTTNRLMTGSLKLGASELLFRMSPLAAVQCAFYALLSGEFGKVQLAVTELKMTAAFIGMLLVNASMAFALNSVSFQTNKIAGALTMSVAANLKQCMTIALGIVLFSVQVTALNGVGMLIALIGATWYSKVELQSKGSS